MGVSIRHVQSHLVISYEFKGQSGPPSETKLPEITNSQRPILKPNVDTCPVNLTSKRACPFSSQIHRTSWLSLPAKVVVAEQESYVTKRRNRKAALKFLRKTMKRYGRPYVIVTDLLRSYGAAMKVIGNAERQETGRWKNNRAENSNLPFRRRERAMLRFRRMRTLQKFVAVHSSVHNHFNQERHLYSRENFKSNRDAALVEWRQLGAA
jgi:putative transposase